MKSSSAEIPSLLRSHESLIPQVLNRELKTLPRGPSPADVVSQGENTYHKDGFSNDLNTYALAITWPPGGTRTLFAWSHHAVANGHVFLFLLDRFYPRTKNIKQKRFHTRGNS